VPDFDPRTPSIARVYDYWLGGKDNFAADRELGAQLMSFLPSIPVTLREHKAFLSLAVTWAANQGISQFIDLGSGMPTSPSTHENAQAVTPGARVAYVDNDAVVLSHLRALSAHSNPGVTVVEGNVGDPDTILAAVAEGVDLDKPSCLIMGSLLHFFNPDDARDLVARYAGALAPGSFVVLTVGMASGEEGEKFARLYSEGPNKLYLNTPEDFATFFGPLELVPPGIGDARVLRPGWEEIAAIPPRGAWMIAGIARVS
jgi:O-methyltransferase involved in polyketide biosynthesis